MAPEWARGDRLRYGSDEQVAYLDPAELETVERFDRWLFVWAPGNTAERAGIASARDAAHGARRARPGMARHDEREAAGELRWVGAALPDGARRADRAHGHRGLGALRLLGAAARRARSGRRLARARRAPHAADRPARGRARAARHGGRHRPARRRRGARLGVVRRRGEPARRRGLLLPAAGRRRGRDHVRRAVAAERPRLPRRAPALRGGRRRRRVGARSARTCCSRASTPTRARAAWASSRSARTR